MESSNPNILSSEKKIIAIFLSCWYFVDIVADPDLEVVVVVVVVVVEEEEEAGAGVVVLCLLLILLLLLPLWL